MTVFKDPAPTPVVFVFAQHLISNHSHLGLRETPETFPKQPRLSENCRYGNWLRLPGRHHTREHWTAVWHDGTWLTGEAAIDRLISTTGDSASILAEWARTNPIETAPPAARTTQPMPSTERRARRTTPSAIPRARAPSANEHIVPSGAWFGISLETRRFLQGDYKDGPAWNDRLFRAACDMAGNEITLEVAMPQLLRGAAPYNRTEEANAIRTIESAFYVYRLPARSFHRASNHDSWTVAGIHVQLGPGRRAALDAVAEEADTCR
jgi:hypothetical protein